MDGCLGDCYGQIWFAEIRMEVEVNWKDAVMGWNGAKELKLLTG